MNKIINRYFVLVVLFIITGIIVNYLSYDKDADYIEIDKVINNIPLDIGNWKGKDVKLKEQIFKILETRSIIHRVYYTDDSQLFLSIVYYPKTKVDFHAPEGCLAGKGIQLSKVTKDLYIDYNNEKFKIRTNQLLRKSDETDELIYYFYKAGDFVGENYIKLRFALALNKFGSQKKSGSLIRVSTPIFQNDERDSHNRLVEFIEDLYPFLIKYL